MKQWWSIIEVTLSCDSCIYIGSHLNMMTSSIGNIFRVTGHLCGEFPGEFSRKVTLQINGEDDDKWNSKFWSKSERVTYCVHNLVQCGPGGSRIYTRLVNPHRCHRPRTTLLHRVHNCSPLKQQTWWRHQMETFSALLAFCAGIRRSPVNSPHKGQWRGALMFSLICARINGWVNNHETGDLRRHRHHNDVTVMRTLQFNHWSLGHMVVIMNVYSPNAHRILSS